MSSKRINIAGLQPVDDPAYRYQMPVLVVWPEGWRRTILGNLQQVSTALHRSPDELLKFFGMELCTHARINPDSHQATLKGSHTTKVLQAIVHRYIEGFVLCPVCRLPETVYRVKHGIIYHKCAACGAKEPVNMEHKLCKFIVAEYRKNKELYGKNKNSPETKQTSFAAFQGTGAEHFLSSGRKERVWLNKDSLPLKEALTVDEQSESIEAAVKKTEAFILENPEFTPEALLATLHEHASETLWSFDMIHIVIRAGFSSAVTVKGDQVAKLSTGLNRLTAGCKYMERHLIAALEGVHLGKPKSFAVVLFQLYELDTLSEDTILEWSMEEGPADGYTLRTVEQQARLSFLETTKPFIEWLQECDEESE